MKAILGSALSGALVIAMSANAQTVPVTAPAAPTMPAATIALPSSGGTLRVGTKIPLKLNEELTTKGKKLRVGYHFKMEVAEAVVLDGQVVIPAGSPAIGEVTDVRNKGMWGKSGRINVQVLYVSVNGRQIRLSGQGDDKGVTGTAGVVAAIAFVPIAGFFTTGTSAKIPLGAPIAGFLDEDVPVTFAATAPTPLVVAPVAAPVTAPVTAPGGATLTPAVATQAVKK